MALSKCGNCRFKAKYDADPGSIIGRLWRWHINWCPGWKAYIKSLPVDERARILDRYGLRK